MTLLSVKKEVLIFYISHYIMHDINLSRTNLCPPFLISFNSIDEHIFPQKLQNHILLPSQEADTKHSISTNENHNY
jgi:hypothetical protein